MFPRWMDGWLVSQAEVGSFVEIVLESGRGDRHTYSGILI